MPIVGRERNYLEKYHRKFICLDEDELFIYGDFSSQNAR